jgi:hypothetical protein
MPVSRPPRAVPSALLIAALAFALLAGPAAAKPGPKFHRGGLPSIGQITLHQNAEGRVEISVPVTYTKALSGPPRGLETSVVFLRIAAQLDRGRPAGTAFESSRAHRIRRDGTIVDRFTLTGFRSRWLLGKSRTLRSQLIRADVRHLIKARRGERPLHEKDASTTMASSHEAQPQGVSGVLTLRNETAEPIRNLATPVMCMYTGGEFGSNLQAFSHEGEPILPGGTIEAEIEADGDILSDAEYEGGTTPFGFDALGVAAEVIGNALEVEAGPLAALIDIATHCESMTSTFSFLAASANGGKAASSEAWVLTDENCRIGCPRGHLISAYDALGFQSPGEANGSQVWATASTEMLEAFAGYYYPAAPNHGQIVQDRGLHFESDELSGDEWEISVGEGSKPAGFSG